MNDPIVIVGCSRTPSGSFQGAFSPLTAADLGANALAAAIERSGVKPENIGEVIMGNVLPAGQGQAPARQAAIKAGIPNHVGATTVNKMCASGMKAVMFAHDLLLANTHDTIVAGGMENMTNAPYLLPKVRAGLRMGHATVYDHMFIDGLEDAYETGTLMGVYAERTAEKYNFSREEQDNFAIASLEKAKKANKDGSFSKEISPVVVKTRKAEVTVEHDEQPGKANIAKIPQLKPAFKTDGTVTAANSSSIADGAAALVLMRRAFAEKNGFTPLALFHGHATYSQEPAWFTTAPVGAIKNLTEKIKWNNNDVDLFEINEAFAVVTMAAMRDLDLPADKVNIHGGACALGHPIGASGARIIVTLLHALQKYDLKKGIAGLCIGGGEATAIAIERIT